MKVAYVSHHLRHNYEYPWFAALPGDQVKIIATEAEVRQPAQAQIEYCQVDYQVTGWENRLFSGTKHKTITYGTPGAQTALRVLYSGFEKYLADVDVVVVLEAYSSLTRQFIEYCRRIGKPVAVLVYEMIDEHPIYKLPRYYLNTKYTLRHANVFIAISEHAARHLRHLGAPADRIVVVNPGIDTELFRPTGRHEPRSLFYLARLEPLKGIDIVLQTYRRLAAAGLAVPLTVVGNGSWQPQVEQLAAEFSSVEAIAAVPNRELPPLMGRHGIYLMPARETRRLWMRVSAEQFAFTVVESMACGLAVVTTDCGALGEIATAANIVCPQNDVDAIFAAVSGLLDDPTRIEQLGHRNRELALQRYKLHLQARRLHDALADILPATGRGAR